MVLEKNIFKKQYLKHFLTKDKIDLKSENAYGTSWVEYNNKHDCNDLC